MAGEQLGQRDLIEQILAERGFVPEALPNMFDLRGGLAGYTTPSTTVGDLPHSVRQTIGELAHWRTMFPQTIDSIIGLERQMNMPYTRGELAISGNQGDADWLARMAMHPSVVSMSGTPQELAAAPDWYADPTNRPTLYEQALAAEPAGPISSTQRFHGSLPHEAFFGDIPVEDIFDQDVSNVHPLARRRLARTPDPYALPPRPNPNWGDIVAADALSQRLLAENPQAYEELLNATTMRRMSDIPHGTLLGLRAGTYHPPALGNERGHLAQRELTRRLASIYSAQGGRHSSIHVPRELHLDPADRGPETFTPGMDVIEKLKPGEFIPGSKELYDELGIMQYNREQGIGRKWYPRPYQDPHWTRGMLNEDARIAARSAMNTRNPTNTRIQELLSEAVGRGKSTNRYLGLPERGVENPLLGVQKMAGRSTVPTAIGGAVGGTAMALLAPIVADKIGDWLKRD